MQDFKSGGVAKWPKATVCKTVIRGFDSHRRLSKTQEILYLGSSIFATQWHHYSRLRTRHAFTARPRCGDLLEANADFQLKMRNQEISQNF
jgi:hypothetical protein